MIQFVYFNNLLKSIFYLAAAPKSWPVVALLSNPSLCSVTTCKITMNYFRKNSKCFYNLTKLRSSSGKGNIPKRSRGGLSIHDRIKRNYRFGLESSVHLNQ